MLALQTTTFAFIPHPSMQWFAAGKTKHFRSSNFHNDVTVPGRFLQSSAFRSKAPTSSISVVVCCMYMMVVVVGNPN